MPLPRPPRIVVDLGRHRLMVRFGRYRFGVRRIDSGTTTFGAGLFCGNHVRRTRAAPRRYGVRVANPDRVQVPRRGAA